MNEDEKLIEKIEQYKNVLSIISQRPDANEHTKALTELKNIFEEINLYSDTNNLGDVLLINELWDLYNKIEDAVYFPIFYHKKIVALAGEFSSGKTSFINSIVFNNENILPTSIEPTTAINTYVVYDKDEGIFIRNSFSGQTKIEEKFYNFITHSFKNDYGMSVRNMVKYVSLHTKNMLFLKRLAFLDTPGYSASEDEDINYTDKNVALDGLKNARGIIWITSAESGTIKEKDLELFEHEVLKSKPLYIVFNKADLQTKSSMDSIIENAYNILKERGFDSVKISPYSSLIPEDYSDEKEDIFDFLDAFTREQNENNYVEDLFVLFNKFKTYYNNLENKLGKETEDLNNFHLTLNSDIEKLKTLNKKLKQHFFIREFVNDEENDKELESLKNICTKVLSISKKIEKIKVDILDSLSESNVKNTGTFFLKGILEFYNTSILRDVYSSIDIRKSIQIKFSEDMVALKQISEKLKKLKSNDEVISAFSSFEKDINKITSNLEKNVEDYYKCIGRKIEKIDTAINDLKNINLELDQLKIMIDTIIPLEESISKDGNSKANPLKTIKEELKQKREKIEEAIKKISEFENRSLDVIKKALTINKKN